MDGVVGVELRAPKAGIDHVQTPFVPVILLFQSLAWRSNPLPVPRSLAFERKQIPQLSLGARN
jgi:hypothetical protein